MAYNWLMMTSSGDDNWPSWSLGLLTDKTKKTRPRSGLNCALKLTVTPESVVTHSPTALLLLFLSLCERLVRQ